jgi:hypothetical protein
MKAIFNIVFTAALVAMLVYRLWENLGQPNPDKQAILLQLLLLVFGTGLFVYRLIKLRNPSR